MILSYSIIEENGIYTITELVPVTDTQEVVKAEVVKAKDEVLKAPNSTAYKIISDADTGVENVLKQTTRSCKAEEVRSAHEWLYRYYCDRQRRIDFGSYREGRMRKTTKRICGMKKVCEIRCIVDLIAYAGCLKTTGFLVSGSSFYR